MSNLVLVYKVGGTIYYTGSAFSHQRIVGMPATWGQKVFIKKLLWLALLSAILILFLFPKATAQWSNNREPSGNQNSAYSDADKNAEKKSVDTGTPPAKAEQPAVSRDQSPSVAQDFKKYTKDEVQTLIVFYSEQFKIDPTVPLQIAYCESGYNWSSKNKTSTASGVFQFIRSTWLGTPEGKQGLSPFDADANVRAAIRKISEGGIGAWNASKSCWK